MTEEVKCDCKEKATKKVREFLFISGGVFVGATLAILVSASILKPKCPPPPACCFPHRPGFERQLPPPPMMNNHFNPEFKGQRGDFCPPRCKCKCHKHKMTYKYPQQPDFQGLNGNFPENAPKSK